MSPANPLTPLVEKLVTADVPTAARALEGMQEAEAVEVFGVLPHEMIALILPHLQVSFAAVLVKDMDPATFKIAIRAMEPKRAAYVLMRLPAESLERLLPPRPKEAQR